MTPPVTPTWTRPANPLASAALVLGIAALAIVLWRWLPIIGLAFSVAGIIVAIPAIIMGHVALQRAGSLGGEGKALALSGLIMGYFTVAFAVIMPVVSTLLFLIGVFGVLDGGPGA